jgi:RND family efflux transporter MFP subunit
MASNRRTILIGAVAAIVVAACVGAYALSRPATMPTAGELAPPLDFQAAQLARPQLRRMAFDLSLPGTVQALSQATVRSKLSAVVHKVTVREGDSVVPGQVLVELETAPLRALLAEREAGLASAKANLEQAKRTRDANAQLVERNFITQSAFDSADSTYQAQAANVAAAQAQLAQVQLQIDDAVVRAPIGGAIARRFVQDGEKVGMDAQLVSIVDLSRLEVQAQAAVSDVARVMPGAPAIVQIEGLSGQSFKGRVDRINPSADPGSRSIDLYVSFANERNIVRSGMFANVRLHLESDREATTLPLSAIQEDGGQPVAWAIKDGHIARRVVSVGRKDQQAQLAEVLGGVAMTDEVLATRFDNLKDGAPVRIVDMAAAPVAGGGPAPGAVH